MARAILLSYSGCSSIYLDGIPCPSTSLCVVVDAEGDIYTSTDPTGGSLTWSGARIDEVQPHLESHSLPVTSRSTATSRSIPLVQSGNRSTC
jgi:hypothetical protein